ncbi:MAG: tetratricopeptide repeat protein [Candidatus Omnitrophica bacterium]|nr:tetratricopeptide repeat protein [Candidatus Omnitrophota bacterium]
MGEILVTIGEKIKRGIETAIGACINPLIKLKEWLKRVKNAILNKLLVKISSLSLEGYTQQLEERMKELGDSLPSEKGKDAKAIFDFISKTPKEDLEKIAILAETVRSIQEKDARAVFEFVSKTPKEELAKILTIAEATTEFKERDAKSISEFIKKFSTDALDKTAILAGTERAIEEKDARNIFEFLNKFSTGVPNDDFGQIASILRKAISTQEGVIPLDERKIEKIEKKIKEMKGIGDISDDEFEEIENVLEQVRRLRSLPYNLIPTKDDAEKIERIRTILAVTDELSNEELKEPLKTEVPSNTSEIIDGAIDSKDPVKISTISKLEDRIETIEDVQLISIPKLYRMGTNFINKRAFEEAYECFDMITKISPNLKGAWLNKGVALFGLGKINEELECYEEALWIDENYDKALHNKEIAER